MNMKSSRCKGTIDDKDGKVKITLDKSSKITLTGDSYITSLENTDSEIVAQIKEGLKQVYIWKITVDESVNVYADARTESFNVDTSIDGKGLSSYCQEI